MLVVLPVCAKDSHLALNNLEHCLRLNPSGTSHPALIVHDPSYDPSSLLTVASRFFRGGVSSYTYDEWHGDPNWPNPQNWSWQNTARHLVAHDPPTPWFWWEADAVPLKPDWLDTLYDAYCKGNKPFAGPIARQQDLTYMAGVAIYPPNTLGCVNALLCRNQPWDVVASTKDGILKRTHDISDLIIHNPTSNSVHFVNMDDVRSRIPDTGILYHKCKDTSLVDVLSDRPVVPLVSDLRDIPSFNEQTSWPTGYFAFPPANQTVYFNCSVVPHDGSLHLFTRRWRYNIGSGPNNTKLNRSDLCIWRIRPNMTLDSDPIIPATPSRFPHEQWEDPRAMIGSDGQTYVAFATWVHYKNWSIRQSLTRLTPDWRRIQPLWEAPYGGNTRTPTHGRQHEKNWIWFEHDGQWHCQYAINPGEVFSLRNGNVDKVYKSPDIKLPWDYGLPLRGGTPPTRVGDEYLAFFHTHTVWRKPKRRYHMGAYTFMAKPPFTITRITPEPLLSGSEHDFRTLGGPLVVFPNGAILQNGEWLVTFGVNDEACGWIRIPHEDLDNLLQPVSPSILSKLVHLCT